MSGPVTKFTAFVTRFPQTVARLISGAVARTDRAWNGLLVDHPGVTAALGWSLSERAVDDLVDQLDLTENRQALDGLRDLLDVSPADTLRCA